MERLDVAGLEAYLTTAFRQPARVMSLSPLGAASKDVSGKFYGYGVPVLVEYRLDGDQEARKAVLHTMSPNPFGHEHMADRAQSLLWSHRAFVTLPRHVRPLDVGGFLANRRMISLAPVEELFLLTEYAPGELYSKDLERIKQTGVANARDLERCDALCDYLAMIHREKGGSAGLYVRRIRELVGHGECIMGLADSYPPDGPVPQSVLREIEQKCVTWRWRLKKLTHRIRQVHGDFHPWNILFREGADFTVLDRSRGEWGDPADDVTCLVANYLFFSLQRSGRLEGAFEQMFTRFWNRYLDATGDTELCRVAAPFFAFRGLVMASPVWYPDLPPAVRQKLLSFVLSVLDEDEFAPGKVNGYCDAHR